MSNRPHVPRYVCLRCGHAAISRYVAPIAECRSRRACDKRLAVGRVQHGLGEQHGLTRKGARHPLYTSWSQMNSRCHNPVSAGFKHYGARGIAVCDRWRKSFAAFVSDMGERPLGTTIDRIDNDRGYEPSNCRWATTTMQARNRRTTKLTETSAEQIRLAVAAGGESYASIGARHGVSKTIVCSIYKGRTWR